MILVLTLTLTLVSCHSDMPHREGTTGPVAALDVTPVPFVGDVFYQGGWEIWELQHGWIMSNRSHRYGMVFVPKPARH
jgi:hypothetical protein